MSELTERIVGIFRQEMKLADVGPDDNFFDLGGDSLMAETITLAVQALAGMPLQTAVLLQAPTPRDLAALVVSRQRSAAALNLVTVLPGHGEAIAMVHGMSGSPLFVNRFGPSLRAHGRVLAIRGPGLAEGETPLTEAGPIVDLYLDAARQAASGLPAIYGGLCVGGLIALAMAGRATATDGRRRRVVLIDPPPLGSVWLKPHGDAGDAAARMARLRRQQRFWQGAARLAVRFGLGRTAAGAKARREWFKKSLTVAFAGFKPAAFDGDILLIASSQWGASTIDGYRHWLSGDASIETIVLPGDHAGFQSANREAIDAAICSFLDRAAAVEPA